MLHEVPADPHRDVHRRRGVPTCTADAPAAMNSSASCAVAIPPTPMMEASGIASATRYTARSASGLMAGPESLPAPAASFGREDSVSMASPAIEFTSVSPRAPEPMHCFAISTTSTPSTDSLANTGTREMPATAAITSPARTTSPAKGRPSCASFAHDRFTSRPCTVRSATSLAVTRLNSSTDRPPIDATMGIPVFVSAGSSSMNASTPGFCRPVAESSPDGVSAIRGAGGPRSGSSVIVRITMPPTLRRSSSPVSSREDEKQPDAIMTGVGSRSPATSTASVGFTGRARRSRRAKARARHRRGRRATGPTAPGSR